MMNKVVTALGFAVMVADAAALAFLMSAWIRDRRDQHG